MTKTVAINPLPDDVNPDWRDLPLTEFTYGDRIYQGRAIYQRTVNKVPCYGVMLTGDTPTITNFALRFTDIPEEIANGLIQL